MSESEIAVGPTPTAVAGKMLVAVSISLLVLQAFVWLWTGNWLNITMGYALEPLVSAVSLSGWLTYPESWFGAHKLMVWLMGMPLALTFFVIGGFMMKGSEGR